MHAKTTFICFDELNDEVLSYWKSLEQNSDHYVFQTSRWLTHWYSTFIDHNNKSRIRVYVGLNSDLEPIFLAPLEVVSLFGVKIARLAGAHVSDYMNVLFSRDIMQNQTEQRALLHQFIDSVSSVDAIHLMGVPESIGRQLNPLHTELGLLPYNSAWSFEFVEDQKTANHSLSHFVEANSDSRRQLKRLREFGAVEFLPTAPDDQFEAAWNALRTDKEARYVDSNSYNPFANRRFVDFYQKFPRHQDGLGDVYLARLTVCGEVVAAHWGVFYRNRYYYLVPAFSDTWRTYSVGRLLMEYLQGQTSVLGGTVFDLAIGNERYKLKAANREMKIYGGVIPRTWRGHLYSFAFKCVTCLMQNTKFKKSVRILRQMMAESAP